MNYCEFAEFDLTGSNCCLMRIDFGCLVNGTGTSAAAVVVAGLLSLVESSSGWFGSVVAAAAAAVGIGTQRLEQGFVECESYY